jgi:hypothetical protein
MKYTCGNKYLTEEDRTEGRKRGNKEKPQLKMEAVFVPPAVVASK